MLRCIKFVIKLAMKLKIIRPSRIKGIKGIKGTRVKIIRAKLMNKAEIRGGGKVESVTIINQERMTCLTDARNIMQRQMKKKGLTSIDMMKIIDRMSEDETEDLLSSAIKRSGLTNEELIEVEINAKKEYTRTRI